MQSVLFHFIDLQGKLKVWFGSEEYMKNRANTCRQLLDILGVQHTEEQRKDLCELAEEDLFIVLEWIREDNILYVERVT